MGIHVRVTPPAPACFVTNGQRYAFTWARAQAGPPRQERVWAKHVCLMAFPPWPAFSSA